MRNLSKRVRTPVALLRSLLGKYPWEKYEPSYPPSYGLNSTTTVLLLYFDLLTCVGENWLMKSDEVKNSHGTLIDWCTGREWPLNCMTVISAWRRLNIRFQRRVGVERLYNSVEFDGPVAVELEIGRSYRRDVVRKATSGRKSHLGPDELGSREDAGKMQ